MKKIITFFVVVFALSFAAKSQTAIVPCGGDIYHASGSISYTVGQIDYIYKDRDSLGVLQSFSAWEGVQQVYPVLELVYDTICPGDSYAENGFNIGPFNTPGLIVDTVYIQSVVQAMNDTTITTIPPDTMKVLYLTIRTLHTATPGGYYIDIIAGNAVSSIYSHSLGNGATSFTSNILPNNAPGINNIRVGNSFIYGLNPLTVSGTYYVEYTTIGPGCPMTFIDTINIMDSLLCSITNVVNDNSCGQGIGSATVNATGGSGNYTYLWTPSGQRTSQATGLTAGTYIVTVTDALMGQTVTATAVVGNETFIVQITADDSTICTGESTQLHTQIIGNNSLFFDYYWTTVSYTGPGTISGRFTDDPTVTVVGTIGDVRTYQVLVTDDYFCTATATISITIECETAPTASWNITPNGGGSPVEYDENVAINITNPQPGNNVDADCGYLYRINGGPWLPWTNTSTPVVIDDEDIFIGSVTFELKHNDTCSAGLITSYTWDITPPIGSISFTRDTWWPTVCISHDSLRLTDIVLQSFDSSVHIYEWMYAYHFQNGTQDSISWTSLTQLNDPILNLTTPYIPVDQSINHTPTQPGDTIFIALRVQHTTDGGATWTTIESSGSQWIIQANPTFDIANLTDGTICENQTHSFTVESSYQGSFSWTYGIAPTYNHNPITGSFVNYEYLISGDNFGSDLYLYNFSNLYGIEVSAIMTPTNGSCPVFQDTAFLTIHPEEELTLLSDSSTQVQEFCFNNSMNEVRYVWSGGADTAVLIWNNVPAGVQVSVHGDTLIISGTPTVTGTYLYSISTQGNCTPVNASGSIKINPLPVFSLTSQDVACHGDSSGVVGVNLITLPGFENEYSFIWTDISSNVVANSSQAQNLYAGTYTVEVTTNATGCSSTASITIQEPATLVNATLSATNVTCNGGNNGLLSVITNGGTVPYTIYIYDTNDLSSVIRGFNNVPAGANRTSTNMRAGTYAVYVYDANGCLFSSTITISEPSLLVVNLSQQTGTTCYDSEDGIAAVTVSGGTSPYSYLWSNGDTTAVITDLAPGTYYVTVTDDNGCVGNLSAVINRPSRITSQFSITSCGTYNWNSISYNHSGNYVQTLTAANNCDSIVTLHLTVLQNSASTQSVSTCGSYTWPVNQTLYTQSGTYTYTLVGANSQGCDSVITLHLSIDATANIDVYETACASFTWNLNQTTYTQSGTYSHMIPSQIPGGCDTTVLLHLIINSPITSHIYVNNCDSFTWNLNQTTYTQSGEYSYTADDGDPSTCDSIFVLHLYIPNIPLGASINHTNNACYGANNGTISISPTGGTAPYNIYIYDTNDLSSSIRGYTAVSNGATRNATGLYSGNYVVYVYDVNGCLITTRVDISEPALLSAIASVQQPVTCNQGTDGSVSVSVAGGTMPYTYLWNTGSTNSTLMGIGSGNYSVTVTDGNNCTATAAVVLNNPAAITSQFAYTSCNSYTWGGTTYTATGNYNKIFTAQNGCDSVVTLNLTIYRSSNSIVSINTCTNYTWPLTGITYTQSGNYSHTIVGGNANGCDSIITLQLNIPATPVSANITSTNVLCNGANNGTISITPSNGIAPYSIYIYDINDLSSSIRGYTAVAAGTSRTATSLPDGTYFVEVIDQYGCFYSANVTISEPAPLTAIASVQQPITCNQGTDGSINVSVAGGTMPYTYLWNTGSTNSTLTGIGSGNYSVTVTDGNNCTATAAVVLNNPAAITSQFAYTACNSYTWGGTTYTATGNYNKTFTAQNGCDSVVTLNLTILRSTSSTVYETACQNYTWPLNGQTYNQSGNYTYTIVGGNANGCDSIVTLSLYIPATTLSASISATDALCYGGNSGRITITVSGGTANYDIDIYNINDLGSSVGQFNNVPASSQRILNNLPAGTYQVEVFDHNGCTYTSTITINQPTQITTSITSQNPTCYGGTNGNASVTVNGGMGSYQYLWSNNSTSASISNISAGYYSVLVTDGNGCTAMSGTTISQPNQIVHEFYVTNCDSYSWNGVQYQNSGRYVNIFVTPSGCDSTAILHLTITRSTTSHIYVSACNAYSWFGNDINQSGIYNHTLPGANSEGCDSIIYLHLTLNMPTDGHVYHNSCGPYTWNGQLCSVTGEYTHTIIGGNSNGCDSIVHLHLTVNTATSETINQVACNSYTWSLNGQTYTQSGDYVYTIVGGNSDGCDSIVTLHLTINQPSTGDTNVTACVSYTWPLNNQTYTQSGDYVYTIIGGNSDGCDSVVTLHLTINQPTAGDTTVAACISYTWPLNNTTYSQSGDYPYTIIGGNSNGCDSTVTLRLTINQPTEFDVFDTACVEYRWNVTNETYYASGDYFYTISEGNSNGCDSTIILHLVINQPSVEEITVITYTPYTWDVTGEEYSSSGNYSHTYYGGAENGCDSTVVLKLTVNTVGIEDQNIAELNISLYPNPTRNYVELVIDETIDVKEAQIFDIYGKLLKIEKITTKHNRISFETFANGVYLLRLNDGVDIIKTFKVIKH